MTNKISKNDYYAYAITLEVDANETKEDSIRIDRGGDFIVYQINAFSYNVSDLKENDLFTIHIKDSGSGKDWFSQPLWSYNILSNYSKPSLNKLKMGKLVKANDQIFITIKNYSDKKIRVQIVLEGYRILK